ncbi:uncharacterized protein LOC144627746 [Crassostrea virginica]
MQKQPADKSIQPASPIIEEIVEEGEKGEEPMEVERAIEPYTNSQVAEEPIGSAQQTHKRRLFSKEEGSVIIELCQPLISQKSAKTGEVLEHLMKDPRGAEIIARIKSLHPDSYRKRLVDRVKCAIRGK